MPIFNGSATPVQTGQSQKLRVILVAFLVGLVVVLSAAFLQILRYEYHYQGHLRIDRLTGQHQYHCSHTNNWENSLADCGSAQTVTPQKDQGTLITRDSGPRVRPAIPCISAADYIAKSERQGLTCQRSGPGAYPMCGQDRNSNGTIEPWEFDGYGIACQK